MRSILGIDTAAPLGSIALAEDGVAVEVASLPPGGHSSGLALAVERLLAARGLAPGSLAGVAVSEGPGSFTGLRIGLAWAKGVALGAGVPLVLVSAHEAAALAARGEAARFATVTQGERGHALAALWAGGEGARALRWARPLWGPEPVPEDELMERLRAAAGGDDLPVAASTEALAEWVLDLGGALLEPGGRPFASLPLAPAIAELGDRMLADGLTADLEAAAPAYGRSPNARKPPSGKPATGEPRA